MDSELQEQLDVCPSCGAEGPPSKYCLSCGKSTNIEIDDHFKIQNKPRDASDSKEVQTNVILPEPLPTIGSQFTRLENIAINDEPDFQFKDNIVDLKKNINLTLWIVDLYLKGEVEEEHFNKLFDAYEYRFEQNMIRRNKMLEIARDLKPMKKAFTEAKLHLAELELRQAIGDISDEEYNVKVPAYKWDINKYETTMANNKANISLLEKFSSRLADEESIEIKEKTENAKKLAEEAIKKGNLNQETVARIKNILDNILSGYKKSKKKK